MMLVLHRRCRRCRRRRRRRWASERHTGKGADRGGEWTDRYMGADRGDEAGRRSDDQSASEAR